MESIKRKVEIIEKEKMNIKRMGINNFGILSLIILDDFGERVINFDENETKKLKEFLKKWQ